MPDDLLQNARQQAEKADLSIRAAALLRIARAESVTDASQARSTLLEALNLVPNVSGSAREQLLQEARTVAAAVSPELLLTAALAGVPEPSITQMKQPNPPNSPRSRGGRIVSSRSLQRMPSAATNEPTMRSPDGRLIRCPKCLFQPPEALRWNCKCGHAWNTFWTSGRCPACRFQWEVTQCPSCDEISEHQSWYVSEP